MNANAALDIAIGLILMYLVLSLVCTSVNEFISTALDLRAASLKQGLEHIIDSKTLRGSGSDQLGALHLVSACATAQHFRWARWPRNPTRSRPAPHCWNCWT